MRVFLLIIITIGGLYLLAQFSYGETHVGNDRGWKVELNSDGFDYYIDCEAGLYQLAYYQKNGNNKIGGVFLGSSTEPLGNYCGKKVKVDGHYRDFKGNPICIPVVLEKYPQWCRNIKTPVLDIFHIENI